MSHSRTYEKNKHFIGEKFNKWTILDIIESKNRHHTFVQAQCDCGTIKEIRLSYITNNRVIDCGCGLKDRLNELIMQKYKHLINTNINGWKVLDIIAPNGKHTHTYALCQCKCGTIKQVKITYLLNEKSKDCGCGRKETLKQIFTKDITGQRFGKLVTMEMLEERNKNGRISYKCKCDCGNEVIVLGNSLTTYHTLSCGCLISYWNMYIQQFLEKQKIEYKPEYTVHIDGKYYRYDFYLPQYNLFIEYDGQQHYEIVRFNGDNVEQNELDFKKTQEHDQIKTRYCEENHINLLRIPYWESKNIETIIINHLQRLNEKGFTNIA